MASAKPRAVRGATLNRESRRFNLPETEVDGDWRDVREGLDGAPPKLRTTVTVEHARTIISRNQSPDVPFDRSINPYRGCEHAHTVACRFAAGLASLHRCEALNQDCASGITEIPLLPPGSAYSTLEADLEVAPDGFSLCPPSRSPSLGIKLHAGATKTIDRCSVFEWDYGPGLCSTPLEPVVLEIREPIADQRLTFAVLDAIMSHARPRLLHGCDEEQQERPHGEQPIASDCRRKRFPHDTPSSSGLRR